MKKILITGKNSYIGTEFKKWTESNCKEIFSIEELNVKDGSWRKQDFSIYDTVIHLAAIVHKKNIDESVYNSINCNLAFEIASKAKKSNIKQFVFLSTMSIYGKESGEINESTIPNPVTFYGKSKLDAEKKIIKLASKSFIVAIIRPPMVYGKGCKGNYELLQKYSKLFPFFPDSHNKRSTISNENLSAFLFSIVKDNKCGFFHPQDKKYSNTFNLIKNLRIAQGYKCTIPIKADFLKNINIGFIKKIFGDLYYSDRLE